MQPLRILIVDDDDDTAYSLAALETMEGHLVRTAHDGQEAVEIANSWSPDVAVLDLDMPVLDGLAAAAAMRAAGQSTVLVALSGHCSLQWKRQAYGAGFDIFFMKGVEFDVLQKGISHALRHRSWARYADKARSLQDGRNADSGSSASVGSASTAPPGAG